MNTSIVDHRVALDHAEKECERARGRHELAQRVVGEFEQSLQRVEALLLAAPVDCDLAKKRLRLALAPALRELGEVVKDEAKRVIAAETRLAGASGRLRQAEKAANNRKPRR
jgi:hypothetical protein